MDKFTLERFHCHQKKNYVDVTEVMLIQIVIESFLCICNQKRINGVVDCYMYRVFTVISREVTLICAVIERFLYTQ